MSFSTFYTAVLSAAATLMGLLFVAVQFNIDRKGHRYGVHWLSLARSTMNIYIFLFLLPLALLVPNFPDQPRGAVVFLLAALGIMRQFACWRPVWRIAKLSKSNLARLLWLLLAPVAADLAIAWFAVTWLVWHDSPDGPGMSFCLFSLFAIALRNSWNLILQHASVAAPPHRKQSLDTPAPPE